MASLIVEDGPLAGRRFEIGDELRIGRLRGDLLLADPEVSRRQAIVRAVPGGFEVEDLGSTNGTFVDGTRIVAPTRLAPGDVVSMGGTSARFEPSDGIAARGDGVPVAATGSLVGESEADRSVTRPRLETLSAAPAPSEPPGSAPPEHSRLARAVIGRRGLRVTIAIWLLLAVVIGGGLGGKLSSVSSALTGSVDALSSSSQSARIAALERTRFAAGETYLSVLVYRRASGLTPADQTLVRADARAVSAIPGTGLISAPFGPPTPVPLVSGNHQVALMLIPLTSPDTGKRSTAIAAIRQRVGTGGHGLQIELTGPAAYQSDLSNAIGAANGTLLAATALLVLLLLIAIYRSPLLALIPLVVVGISYLIATGLIYLYAKATGQIIDKTVLTLLAVLMFGAGTDYCLLLVSRYTADLRQIEDKREAMAAALSRTTHPILASGCTVAGAMLTFFLASLKTDSQLAVVNAIGIVVVMVAGITLLPALLTLAGRRAFWPNRSSVEVQPGRSLTGVIDAASVLGARPSLWFRLATRVTRRPVWAILATVALLGAGAVGITTLRQNVAESAQFRVQNDSTRGLKLLLTGFPAGASYPETVMLESRGGPLTAAQVQAARTRIAAVQGIASVSQVLERSRDGELATLSVSYRDPPFSDQALSLAGRLRTIVAHVAPGVTGLVGDGSSQRLDYRDEVNSDMRVVVPAVLIVIFVMLAVLLRALVAPLYLLATVVLSYAGTLGISLLTFKYVFGNPPVDPFLPLITFVFLVALGVDYNIFLMSRVREEALRHGTSVGLLRALVATGPVVTSAGIILAGTFAVLTILPLWILLEIGFTVSLGVLIDTFLVRTIAVPAIVRLVGDASWWPSSASGGARAPTSSGAFTVPPAMRAQPPSAGP